MRARVLIVTILALILFCPASRAASSISDLTVTGGALKFDYAFSSDEEYVVLKYTASMESGRLTLHGADGSFAGEVKLQCSFQADEKVTVRIESLDQKELARATTYLTEAKVPEAPDGWSSEDSPCKKVRDFVCEPIDGGIRYSFTALGREGVILKYKTSQETGTLTLYPGADGLFSGEVRLNCTYRQSNVFLKLYPLRGDTLLAEGETTCGYTLTAGVNEPGTGRLSGVTVCIDPGHQNIHRALTEPMGPNLSGTTTSTGGMAQGKVTRRKESIVVLEIAYKLRDELRSQGASVVMTRDTEETWLSNQDRAAAAEEGGADFMLRLHCDTRDSDTARGISVYCPLGSSYAKEAAPYEEYKALAGALLNAMKTEAGYALQDNTGRTVFNNNYVGNNWAKMPCFLIEMGFMSNPREDVLLSCPDYQTLLAEGMAQGVHDMAVLRGLIDGE